MSKDKRDEVDDSDIERPVQPEYIEDGEDLEIDKAITETQDSSSSGGSRLLWGVILGAIGLLGYASSTGYFSDLFASWEKKGFGAKSDRSGDRIATIRSQLNGKQFTA